MLPLTDRSYIPRGHRAVTHNQIIRLQKKRTQQVIQSQMSMTGSCSPVPPWLLALYFADDVVYTWSLTNDDDDGVFLGVQGEQHRACYAQVVSASPNCLGSNGEEAWSLLAESCSLLRLPTSFRRVIVVNSECSQQTPLSWRFLLFEGCAEGRRDLLICWQGIQTGGCPDWLLFDVQENQFLQALHYTIIGASATGRFVMWEWECTPEELHS